MDPKTLSNQNCYKIDELHLDRGLLDTLVDAVYVLLLENSPRSESVYRQLNEYKLSRNVFVFINKGYKHCEKRLCQQKPAFDLMDANAQVMYHSQEKGYNNILILEDDFLFDDRIRDPVILQEIGEFVNKREFNVYNLGVIGLPIDPWATHMRMFVTGIAHAVIYSPQGKQRVLDEYKKDPCMTSPWISRLFVDFRGHDLWYNRFLEKQYSYKTPICYQIFPDTENKKEWQTSIGNLCLSLLKLTKQPKPGWDNLYMLFKIISYVLYFVIVFVLYILYKKIR
tara:strand:- start:3 stop:848 length:846 start_codon:yes stop_codon:yes gene_type:complete